jgi:hypothetical protein
VIALNIWLFANSKKVKAILLIVLCFVLIYSFIRTVPRFLFNIWVDSYDYKVSIQNGADYDVPLMGIGFFKEGVLKDEQIIQKSLDKVLDSDETFLDLTTDGLHYFVGDRKLWLEYPTYYVFPGNKPARRAVEVLQSKNIVVSLLDNSLVLDKSNVNLRAYHLYRYALLEGLPWEISPHQVILMPANRFAKIGLKAPNKLETLKILDNYFPIYAIPDSKQKGYDSETELFFEHLPAVWGAGFANFQKDLMEIIDFPVGKQELSESVQYEISPAIKGIQGGLLYVDVSEISEGDTIYLSINWINEQLPKGEINEVRFIAHKGINLVPVDAAPRWLLADKISSLTISATKKDKFFVIKKLKLFDRTKI